MCMSLAESFTVMRFKGEEIFVARRSKNSERVSKINFFGGHLRIEHIAMYVNDLEKNINSDC